MTHNTFENRGQGTTEYLIILAIVIVIALVVVGVLGGFPSIGQGISQGQSKAYWGSVQPLAVIEWSSSTSTGSIVFQNNTANTITVTDVNWNGSGTNITDVNVSAGGKATVTNTDFTCGTSAGQAFTRTLGYTYNTSNLSGLRFFGVQSIVGQCQ